MKKLIGVLLGISVILTAYAANPVSTQYVDQTFSVVQQTYTDLQQQINNLNKTA